MTSRWLVCAFALLLGCSEGGGMSGDGGAAGNAGTAGTGGVGGIDANPYASKDLWLCRPDIEDDYCDTADMSTTEIHAEGTQVEVAGPQVDPDATFDCFIVHSTGNDIQEPGNVETISPPSEAVVNRILGQAAPFRSSCHIFAPAYHMMTIGTYSVHLQVEETEYFARASGDVVEAFDYYLRNYNDGRDVVLIGESQGSRMIRRLLEVRFDENEALRRQLMLAVLMGAGGDHMYVPAGELAGGSLTNIRLCSSETETGCVIAFETWADLSAPSPKDAIPPGMAGACVNPASLDNSHQKSAMKAFWFDRNSGGESFPEDVTTNWVYLPELLSSQCVGSRLLLSKTVADDPRAGSDFPRSFAREDGNLHWGSVVAAADLIERIAEQARAR